MKTSTIRSIAFTAVTLTTIGFIGATIASRSFAKEPVTVKQTPSWDNYDWAKSETNLRAIGQALQVYRQHNGISARNTWASFHDAGFAMEPVSLVRPLLEPNKPWTIPNDIVWAPSDPYKFPGKRISNYLCPFQFAASDMDPLMPTPSDAESVWALRGEEVPVLIDINMHSASTRANAGSLPILVLRLNGRVDRINANIGDLRDIFLRK